MTSMQVEVFLSPSRNLGEEYHFILNAEGSRLDEFRGKPAWKAEPDWQGAVQRTEGGWSAEIAIPAECMVQGDLLPRLGDVWNLKLTRENRFGAGEAVEYSSWTPIGASFADPAAVGSLVFISRNIMLNGGFSQDTDGDEVPDGVVMRKGRYGRKVVEAEELRENVAIAGPAPDGRSGRVMTIRRVKGGPKHLALETRYPMRENRAYRFSAWLRADTDEPEARFPVYASLGTQVRVDIGRQWKPLVISVSTANISPHERPGMHLSSVAGRFEICDARLEMLDEFFDPDLLCLTGNVEGAPGMEETLAEGRYTYYEGGYDTFEFPLQRLHGPTESQQRGWLSFQAGRLTNGDRGEAMVWRGLANGANGGDLLFDLGRDVELNKVELFASRGSMNHFSVWTRATGEALFTCIYRGGHPNSVRQHHKRGYLSAMNLRVRARQVRLQIQFSEGTRVLGEAVLWGKAASDGTPPPLAAGFPPLENRADLGAAEAAEAGGGGDEGDLVFPTPREVAKKPGRFALTGDTVIVIGSKEDKRAVMTAEVLREKIESQCGFSLRFVTAAEAGNRPAPCIALGEADTNPVLTRMMKKLRVPPPDREVMGDQGYVLSVAPQGVCIVGAGELGTLYGVSTFTQLIQANGDVWQAPAREIRDWPELKYRTVYGGIDDYTKDFVELFRAMGALRVTHVFAGAGHLENAMPHMAAAERYGVKLVPILHRGAMTRNRELVERAPGEDINDKEKFGVGRFNPCPSNPKTYQTYFAYLDRYITKLKGDFVYINCDEMYQPGNGARWNVCKLCRTRNLSGHELMADYLKKIHAHLKKRGKRMLVCDGVSSRRGISYQGDTGNDWTKVAGMLPRDVAFTVWHDNFYDIVKGMGFDLLAFVPSAPVRPRPGMTGWFGDMADRVFAPQDVAESIERLWHRYPDLATYNTPRKTWLIEKAVALWNAARSGAVLPSVGRLEGDYVAIDLRKVANESLRDDKPCDGKGFIDNGPQRDLRALKPGRRFLAGTLFDIIDESRNNGRGCVVLHNRGRFNRRHPSFAEIPVGRRVQGLSFLHALDQTPGWCYSRRPKLVGYYEMVYADGTFDTLTLMYNDNIANWDRYREYRDTAPSSRHIGQARIGWLGWTVSGEPATLYIADWINPRPDQVIAKVRFHATEKMTAVSPFLVAMTATVTEEAAPTAKPAALPVYAGHFTVVEPAGTEIALHPGRDVQQDQYVTDTGIEVRAGGDDGLEKEWIRTGKSVTRASWAGDLAFPDNLSTYIHGRGAGFVTVQLPQPERLAGVQLRGKVMRERGSGVRSAYSAHCTMVVKASVDGKTFTTAATVADYVPERDVPIWVDLAGQQVHTLRVEFGSADPDNREDWQPGLSSLRLFKED